MSSKTSYYQRTPAWGDPPLFSTDSDAQQWAIGQGAYSTEQEAAQAFDELRRRHGAALWPIWLGHVARRLGRNKT